jgi:hypothetical protein
MARFASASWLFEDNDMCDETASVTLDEFGVDFFPVNHAPIIVPVLLVKPVMLKTTTTTTTTPATWRSKLSLLIPVVGESGGAVARKPVVTKAAVAADYRKRVAIPRYLDKRLRRKWEKELMHPSRSAAAHRRPRNGGQFGVVHVHV